MYFWWYLQCPKRLNETSKNLYGELRKNRTKRWSKKDGVKKEGGAHTVTDNSVLPFGFPNYHFWGIILVLHNAMRRPLHEHFHQLYLCMGYMFSRNHDKHAKKSAGILPGEVRKRHCPVIGSYSWFSSEHRQRKEPSTFSQRASPQTPLSISHSFTSGEKGQNVNRFRPTADSFCFYLLYLCQYCLPDYRCDLWGKIKNSLMPKWIHKQVVRPFEIQVPESHSTLHKNIGAD